jgi:hypothetical protein
MSKVPDINEWPRTRPTTIAEACKTLRAECGNLEWLIECEPLSEKQAKQLDKAVVVMKAGLKIAKKATRKSNVVPLPRTKEAL